jgi:hypothetical protein
VQPRAFHAKGPIRTWTADAQELRLQEAEIRRKAKQTDDPNAPLRAGEHCRFCKAAAVCPERRAASLRACQIEFAADGEMSAPEIASLGADQLGRLLSEIDQVEAWCKRVREYAFAEATNGHMPAGWKLVARRAVRKWNDEGETAKVLKLYGLHDEEIFTRKILSPAQADKLVGKKDAKALASLWSKTSSGATLAPESDPRESVKSDPSLEFGE